MTQYQYHEDISIMTDEEDGVWVARLYRHEQGFQAIPLDTNNTRTETVREAIDAIPPVAMAQTQEKPE